MANAVEDKTLDIAVEVVVGNIHVAVVEAEADEDDLSR